MRFSVLAAIPLTLALAACGQAQPPASVPAKAAAAVQADPGYLVPPAVTAVRRDGEALRLSGIAPPNARVRLATPEGQAVFAEADGKGAWALSLPPAPDARIFGLSAAVDGRSVQSEGYVLVTAEGEAVGLRAGGGAVRVGRSGRAGLDVIDFDRQGGAVVSGRAPTGAALSIHVDGRKLAEGRADSKGRYAIALTQQPLAGRHQIDVFGDATESTATLDITPAAPLSTGPFRATAVDAGLRVDWLTPAGGVQSTVLLK